MAVVRAVNFALDLSLTSIMIEDDLEIIIKALYIEDESLLSRPNSIWLLFLLFNFHISVDMVITLLISLLNMLVIFRCGWRMFHQHINSILLVDFG